MNRSVADNPAYEQVIRKTQKIKLNTSLYFKN